MEDIMAESHQEIYDSAQKKIADLQTADLQINIDINTIKDKEWDGPLSASDRDRLVELRSTKASILAAIEELGFVTMAALDKTDELRRINNAIAGVVEDLKNTVARIVRIGQIADTIKQVLGGVQDLSKSIKDLTDEG
jgi:hypothetical protein